MDRISAIAFLRCRTGVVAPRFEVIGDQDAKPKSFNCPTKTAPASFPASSRSLLRNVSLQQSDDINHNCLASCTHMRAGAEVLPSLVITLWRKLTKSVLRGEKRRSRDRCLR